MSSHQVFRTSKKLPATCSHALSPPLGGGGTEGTGGAELTSFSPSVSDGWVLFAPVSGILIGSVSFSESAISLLNTELLCSVSELIKRDWTIRNEIYQEQHNCIL